MKKLIGNTENKLITWVEWDGKKALTKLEINVALERMNASLNATFRECSAGYRYDQYDIDRMTATKEFFIK